MFSRREKVLLALAAVAVAVVVSVQLSATVTGTAKADQSRDIARWKALRQSVADAEAQLLEITSPESEAAVHLLRATQASGSATGVTVTSARPRKATRTSSRCLEQTLEVQAAGRFPNIARFMFDLEARNANIRIARVAVTSSDAGSDKVNCTIMIAGYSPGEVER